MSRGRPATWGRLVVTAGGGCQGAEYEGGAALYGARIDTGSSAHPASISNREKELGEQIAETRISAFEVIVALVFRDAIENALVTLVFRDPYAFVVSAAIRRSA